MPYTPVELRHVRLGRALFGYKREETERLLDEVADSFEDVWRDRGELGDKVDELEKRLEEFKQREQLLSATLVAAERAAAEAKEAARREADLIVSEAHQEARSVIRGVHGERERLVAEARRVEALLRSALGMVEEGVQGASGAEPGQSDSWPARQDTREFAAVREPEQQADPPPPPAVASTPAPATEPEQEHKQKPAEVPLPPILAIPDDESEGDVAPGRDFAWG
jgi:cell division initiation protein